MLKSAFYSCDGPSDAPYFDADALYNRTAVLGKGYDSHLQCIGLGLGLAHGLAPFACMYLLWGLEREYKASYSCRSRSDARTNSRTNAYRRTPTHADAHRRMRRRMLTHADAADAR